MAAPAGLSRAEVRRQRKRGDYLAATAALLAAIVLGAMVTAFVVLSNDLDEANQARDALARQVQGLGEKPVAGPPGSRGEAGEGEVGATGPPGPPGPAGTDGKDAPTITPAAGSPGPPGPTGPPGADSVVPGPTGPPGPGATGAPGSDGVDGRDGEDGAPPSEWTYTDPDGVTYRCTPVDDFDPANPRYRCTPTATSAPDPTPTVSHTAQQPPAPDQKPTGSGLSELLPLGLLDRRLGGHRCPLLRAR